MKYLVISNNNKYIYDNIDDAINQYKLQIISNEINFIKLIVDFENYKLFGKQLNYLVLDKWSKNDGEEPVINTISIVSEGFKRTFKNNNLYAFQNYQKYVNDSIPSIIYIEGNKIIMNNGKLARAYA